MDPAQLEEYLVERNTLSLTIAKGIIKTISAQLKKLPEEALEEMGATIRDSSNEIAEAILDIMSAEEYEGDCDCEGCR
ncbi:MAG: hypothetical protein HUU50_03305 [Candidatus Brocadiae bacterium]|nr:hypothetical protein [Candidatus Brocadiia bacterium]